MEPRKLVAEALGTALLVFVGVGVATLSFGFKAAGLSTSAGIVATAMAFGFVLLALAYTLGPITGAHVNPAVTMGFVASGRMAINEAIGYWIAQFVGGIAGAAGLWAIFSGSPAYSTSTVGLGTNGWGKASMIHIDLGGAFATEVVITFIFVLVVLTATSRIGSPGFAGLAIGVASDGRAPDRDPADRDVGEPGAQPRSGDHRRRRGDQAGLAVHRRPAGGRCTRRARVPVPGSRRSRSSTRQRSPRARSSEPQQRPSC